MRTKAKTTRRLLAKVLLLSTVFAAAGCPELPGIVIPTGEYEIGFNDGFLQDDWYWDGYFDGWDTIDFTPIYYDDSGIPYVDFPEYDAGYWDGVWYAYNDGYFVDYHYAFVVGFSEGYDNAFWPDYLDFLAVDTHTEFAHGGWIDGYEDGYSEGRIFGANDYEQGLPFDWLDALYDYESGTDLYFWEVDKGTGIYGPVILYEYGTYTGVKPVKARARTGFQPPTIRSMPGQDAAVKNDLLANRELFRAISTEARDELSIIPEKSLRSDVELMLETDWYERIRSYLNGYKNRPKRLRARTVHPALQDGAANP